jgi:hypothetical protein
VTGVVFNLTIILFITTGPHAFFCSFESSSATVLEMAAEAKAEASGTDTTVGGTWAKAEPKFTRYVFYIQSSRCQLYLSLARPWLQFSLWCFELRIA